MPGIEVTLNASTSRSGRGEVMEGVRRTPGPQGALGIGSPQA